MIHTIYYNPLMYNVASQSNLTVGLDHVVRNSQYLKQNAH